MRRLLPIILISISLCFLPSSGISDDHDKYLSQWLELLKNGNSKEKQLALQNLWLLQYEKYRKDPRVLDPIFAALKDKDPLVREAAAAYWTRMTGPLGLSMTKADIPAHLIPLLEDEVPSVRAEAAKAANGIKIYATQQLVDALIKSFRDKDIWVRLNAVYALGELGYRFWSVTPERWYQTSSGNVRKKVQRNDILPPSNQTSSAEVQKMKRGIVTSSVSQSYDTTVRKQELAGDVIPSRDESPSGRALRKAPLKRLIESPIKTGGKRELLARSPDLNLSGAIAPMIELFGRSGDWREIFVKQEVVYAFAKMHVQDEKAIAALLQQYDQAYLKRSVIKALGILEALQAEKTLLKSLEDNNEGIRNDALEALLQLPVKWEERNRKKIIQDCRDKLNSPYPEVRTYAVKVLGKWDRKAGEVFILQALRDKSEKVVQAAIEELGNTESDKFLSDILPYFGHSSKKIRDASVRAFHQLALRTTNERVYAERKGTARIILKIDDGLPRENEHLLHRTASGLLVSELAKGDTPGKISALSIIDEFEDERIEPQLLRLLDDKVPDIRNRASYLLQEYGTEQSVPGLINALKSSDRTLKLNVILALDVIGDKRAKEPLLDLLKDKDATVRTSALHALKKYDDPEVADAALSLIPNERSATARASAALAALVDRKSPSEMHVAMDLFNKTKDPRAVEPLIAIVKEGDISVAGEAANLLGTIGDRRAVEPLMEKLVYLDGLGPGYSDNFMKHKIIFALKTIKDPRAVPVLIQMLKSDSFGVVEDSISALGEFKDSRAVPALIAVSDRQIKLNNGTLNFVQSSTRALGAIGSPAALDHLEKLLYKYNDKYNKDHKIDYTRSDIISAIGEIKGEKTVALLARYIDSSELLLGDIPNIIDILIKNNHKSPTTIKSLIRVSGKTQRNYCDSFAGKFVNFSENQKDPTDIEAILITSLREDNKDSNVGGIRIVGYFYRYKIVKDQRVIESLKTLRADSDSRVRSEAEEELKLIKEALSKNVK